MKFFFVVIILLISMKPLLIFEHVTKKYSTGEIALDRVSFTLYEGEFVFVVGPSGAGKSTIAKLAIREEVPTEGKIIFDGKDITTLNGNGLHNIRREIGVVFQDFRLLQNQTIYENLAFVLEIQGTKTEAITESVLSTLDLVGLLGKKDSFPYQLSGGEQQRATIARAIVAKPRLLIADEPTGNLDEQNTWDIVQLFNKINNWGTTIMVATHNVNIVNCLQRRVIALQNGQIVRDAEGGYHLSSKTKTKKSKNKKHIEQNASGK